MNTHWIKHKNLYKKLIAFISMCLVIEIGRTEFQYYAQRTKFSGSVIGTYRDTKLSHCFVIKDPNHLENETILDVSAAVPKDYKMRLFFNDLCHQQKEIMLSSHSEIKFQIRRLLLCHPYILTNQCFKPFCQTVKFLLYPTVFLHQLSRLANAVNQGAEFRNHVLFDFHQRVQCLDENLFGFCLRQMLCATRLGDYCGSLLL